MWLNLTRRVVIYFIYIVSYLLSRCLFVVANRKYKNVRKAKINLNDEIILQYRAELEQQKNSNFS